MTVQTGPDRGTVLQSGPKIRDWTAYKSVRSGPVSLVNLSEELECAGQPKTRKLSTKFPKGVCRAVFRSSQVTWGQSEAARATRLFVTEQSGINGARLYRRIGGMQAGQGYIQRIGGRSTRLTGLDRGTGTGPDQTDL